MNKFWCPKCDDTCNGTPCPACGAETDPWPIENPREKNEDDGREYGHPWDHLKGID